jgi:hypothetical protein
MDPPRVTLLTGSSDTIQFDPRTEGGLLPMTVRSNERALSALPYLFVEFLSHPDVTGYMIVHKDEITLPIFGKLTVSASRALTADDVPMFARGHGQ